MLVRSLVLIKWEKTQILLQQILSTVALLGGYLTGYWQTQGTDLTAVPRTEPPPQSAPSSAHRRHRTFTVDQS